jgi:hypothetical protein
MSLRSSYEFLKDYCGTYVMKQSIIDLKDTIVEQGKGENSTMNLQGGPSYSGPVNGRLYRNTYIPYCLCGIPYCCIRNTYELSGYNQKLSETTIPRYIFFYLVPVAHVPLNILLLMDRRKPLAT